MEKAKWQTEPQYDEGIELPKGFSSWSEVLKDSFFTYLIKRDRKSF